jgi:hypothetical protein
VKISQRAGLLLILASGSSTVNKARRARMDLIIIHRRYYLLPLLALHYCIVFSLLAGLLAIPVYNKDLFRAVGKRQGYVSMRSIFKSLFRVAVHLLYARKSILISSWGTAKVVILYGFDPRPGSKTRRRSSYNAPRNGNT